MILERLDRESAAIKADFESPKGVATKFAAIDDLLPQAEAEKISAAFPASDQMRLLDSFREKKYTSKSLGEFASVIADITFKLFAAIGYSDQSGKMAAC